MVNKNVLEKITKDMYKLQELYSWMRHKVHITIWEITESLNFWGLYQDWKNYFILKYDWIELKIISNRLEICITDSLDILNKSKKLIKFFFDNSYQYKDLEEKHKIEKEEKEKAEYERLKSKYDKNEK